MTREILLMNDDSVNAAGIRHLAQIFRRYGDVTVVAPKDPQSAKSAALTMDRPLTLRQLEVTPASGELGEVRVYSFDGTPADCAKMGVNMFIEEGRMPDLAISGINHGSNASVAALYSGTLGAITETTLYGIPSIGFSLDCHDDNPDFAVVDAYVDEIMERFFACPPAKEVYLNINFPDIAPEQVRGIRLASQGRGRWHKEFVKGSNPRGGEIYWMVGEFLNLAPSGDDVTDDHVLMKDGYITISPRKVDPTDYDELERLSGLWDFE